MGMRVAGIITNDYYGAFPHSLLSTSKSWVQKCSVCQHAPSTLELSLPLEAVPRPRSRRVQPDPWICDCPWSRWPKGNSGGQSILGQVKPPCQVKPHVIKRLEQGKHLAWRRWLHTPQAQFGKPWASAFPSSKGQRNYRTHHGTQAGLILSTHLTVKEALKAWDPPALRGLPQAGPSPSPPGRPSTSSHRLLANQGGLALSLHVMAFWPDSWPRQPSPWVICGNQTEVNDSQHAKTVRLLGRSPFNSPSPPSMAPSICQCHSRRPRCPIPKQEKDDAEGRNKNVAAS